MTQDFSPLIDDLRVHSLRPLLPPAILIEELPLAEKAARLIAQSRKDIEAMLKGQDDRLLVITGPCSIHDTEAASEYAHLLRDQIERFHQELCIVMRVYFEKPRTTVGWKGLINDPCLDNSFKINTGLRIARRLLCDLAEQGIPAATEFLDTIIPQFIADLITWGAIGARTTESQVHRELASGLSMPVGFKNGTTGNSQVMIDAIGAARHPHSFLSVTKQGIAAIVTTNGNDSCHAILRGGTRTGPNYDQTSVSNISSALQAAGLPHRVVVDCSHGNSKKIPTKQIAVAQDICKQVTNGSQAIFGVMLESHLAEGHQSLNDDQDLVYGKSITDPCISWKQTLPILEQLALAVMKRRLSASGYQ